MAKHLINPCAKANKQGLFCAPSKIKISNKLFYSTVDLLEKLDIEDFDYDIVQLYGFVLHAFNNKIASLELRNSLHNAINPGIANFDSGCFVCTCQACGDVPF